MSSPRPEPGRPRGTRSKNTPAVRRGARRFRPDVFGARLRSARSALGWGQKRLAENIGASTKGGMVSNWEGGRRVPAVGVLLDLAIALGVSRDWLVGRDAVTP